MSRKWLALLGLSRRNAAAVPACLLAFVPSRRTAVGGVLVLVVAMVASPVGLALMFAALTMLAVCGGALVVLTAFLRPIAMLALLMMFTRPVTMLFVFLLLETVMAGVIVPGHGRAGRNSDRE